MHTDVPEFRGANRKKFPQWLMVAMHHSGLFDAWRMPIVTGVAWFSACAGGEFVFYPDGAERPRVGARRRSATPPSCSTPTPCFTASTASASTRRWRRCARACTLVCDGDGRWSVRDGDAVVAAYDWDELRFSISWKAYCFADEAERRAWQRAQRRPRARPDPRPPGRRPARAAAASTATRPAPTDLALLIIDEYIKFPAELLQCGGATLSAAASARICIASAR